MNIMATNEFLKFYALGYTRLVPIVPPTAEISARSSLSKRIGTSQDPRGKAPGIRGQDGKWFGFDWLPYEADERDINRWNDMGAGIGIKTGQGIAGIDADTTNVEWAVIVRDTVEKHFGRLPTRVGQSPKALYLIGLTEPYRYTRVEFGNRDEKGRLLERVEILSDGRQFVAHGIHPKTQKPYTWPRPIVPLDDLPTFTPAQIDAFMAELQSLLPQAAPIVREGASTEINQQALRGTLEAITKAVRATPNTTELFPSREDYRNYGYAIKAALPEHPNEAFALFADWCDLWQGKDGEANDPDIVAADWGRMKAPFRRGAGFVYELAGKYSDGKFNEAEIWFEPIVPSDNPFAIIAEQEAQQTATDTYRLLTIDEIVNRPPPTWLLARHVPEKAVGFLYSEPGVGKSFLALDMGLSIAHGLADWHGDEIRTSDASCVIYIASEGSYGFRNRIKAWRAKRNLPAGVGDNRFFLLEQSINFMKEDDVAKLLRTLGSVTTGGAKPCLVIVDTVSRALPGADENLQKDMTLFVRACDAVKDTFGCAVLGVHHSSKQGGMRGSTVLLGAGDFVFSLSRKKGATIGLLECEKQKDGPDGWEEPYRFETVAVGVDGETSLVVERAERGVGPSVTLTPDTASRVLEAMRAAWDAGEPWSKAPNTKERYGVKRMIADYGFDGARAEELLLLWEQTGLIAVAVASSDSKKKGFKVVDGAGPADSNTGIFE
jgi:hypothetical protein